jgi:hypothetical protein
LLAPDEWGALMARTLLDDLDGQPDRGIVIDLSHDAFQQRTDERTIADQIAHGMQFVLGPDSVYVPDLRGIASPFAREELQQNARIVIRRCQKHRVSGWNYLHSLMRWWPAVPDAAQQFDPAYALSLTRGDGGQDEYKRYMALFEKPKEALPKLQIWKTCPRLIEAIPKIMCDDPDRGNPEDMSDIHFFGLDYCDALRYLGLAHQQDAHVQEPFQEYFERRMERARAAGAQAGTSLVWAARRAEAEYEDSRAPLHVVRASSRRRLLM